MGSTVEAQLQQHAGERAARETEVPQQVAGALQADAEVKDAEQAFMLQQITDMSQREGRYMQQSILRHRP